MSRVSHKKKTCACQEFAGEIKMGLFCVQACDKFAQDLKDKYLMNPRTSIQQERQEAINWLIEQFPASFFSKSKQVKPLKLGIYEDLLDFYERLTYPPLSKKSLRDALNYYSSSKAYLSCQIEGANRIDLFGYATEPVTKEQATYAQTQLAERFVPKNIPAKISIESPTDK